MSSLKAVTQHSHALDYKQHGLQAYLDSHDNPWTLDDVVGKARNHLYIY